MTDNVTKFGRGIICPFQRDGKGDFANDKDLPLLRSDIRELIGIIGPTPVSPGELPWNTELGSRVILMKHRNIHEEMARATAHQLITEPVRRWEKRARPGTTTVTKDDRAQILNIHFTYQPKGYTAKDRLQTVTIDTQGEG